MNSDDLLPVMDAIYSVRQTLERQNDRLDDLIVAIKDLERCFSAPNGLSLNQDFLKKVLAAQIVSALIARNLPLDMDWLAEMGIKIADYMVTNSFSCSFPTNSTKGE